jgi:putative FmdB family regulatory protein
MPLKDYACRHCGDITEHLIRNQDDIPKQCPSCGSTDIFSSPTAHGGVQGSFGTVPKKNAGSYARGKK